MATLYKDSTGKYSCKKCSELTSSACYANCMLKDITNLNVVYCKTCAP